MAMKDEMKVYIGKSRIALIGLKSIFEEIKEKKLTGEKDIKDFILLKVKENNYVPSSAEQEYRDSLFEEYKIYIGELKERKIPGLLEIKILGPGCYTCDKMEEYTKEILSETGIAADVEHVRDLNEIAQYGLIATPALLINKKVVASGRLPNKRDIERWIKEAVKT
jgi:small redox-active disulfide protein 2